MPETDPERILIVDDNRVNRLVLEKRLQQEGYEAVAVEGGAEALRCIGLDAGDEKGATDDDATTQTFDAIVLDVMMPEIDGLEVLRRIREVRSANELPVIMATAKDQSADIVEALGQGANDYVVKPIDMPVLLARLGTQVRLRRTHLALKEAQKSLIDAAKMESVGYLAAGVAHEVRNPLAQIQMGVEAIRGSEAAMTDPDIEPVLEIVADAVKKADDITRELMRVSTTGKLELAPGSVNEMIDEVWQSVKSAAVKAGVEVELELDATISPVALAPAEMRSVLTNVMMNAIEAMPEGGGLTVSTREAEVVGIARDVGTRSGMHLREGEDCVVIEVVDTGPGIAPEKLSSIFDVFFTSKATGKGTGLGLSVARKVIELHNGTIHLENRLRRSGVRVMIQLPKATSMQTTV